MGQYWNVAKTALRLKLGLSNPYRIKDQFSIIGSQIKKVQARFLQKSKINRNTYLYRLQLPDKNKCLGLMIGQYVKILVNGEFRSYNPISRIDEPGHVDFLIRDLRQQNGSQSFTNHLLTLKQGDYVEIEGPYTQYKYHGYGKLEWPSKDLQQYKHLGIIAFQSGITGAYRLIDSLMPCYDNRTAISLLWVGKQMDDFIFIEEFSMLSEQYKLNFNLMLRKPIDGWIGPYGNISKSHIEWFMPPPTQETAMLLFGGPNDTNKLGQALRSIGYGSVMDPVMK